MSISASAWKLQFELPYSQLKATMFGALNRFISRLDSESPGPRGQSKDGGYGFQVLRNNDPAVPIEPWFDFIVGINGRMIVCSQWLYSLTNSMLTGVRRIQTQGSSRRRFVTALVVL